MTAFSSSKRRLLAGGLALGGLGLLGLAKPGSQGGNHNAYFSGLGKALDQAGLARPTLVIDRQLLQQNIATLKSHLGDRYHYRVVAKSLPSLRLLETVMEQAGTQRLMVFHQPFLNQLAQAMPATQLLLGKPMPVAAADRFYSNLGSSAFDTTRQLQWLIDNPSRLIQYSELAEALGTRMAINLELDIGLHRGGFKDATLLSQALEFIEQDPGLSFSGFMGYEAHVAKMPAPLGGPTTAFAAAQQSYRDAVSVAEQTLGRSIDALTLNAAGSPTYQLYDGSQPGNELAAGSCLLKPVDFDLPTLVDHQPAAFIASPVIKALDRTDIPGAELITSALSWWDPNLAQTFFIYGGNWQARPESPPGLQTNALFGHSSNQEMLNGSADIQLKQDEWVFLRPNQSESVLLQFGDIAVYDQQSRAIVDFWPVLSQGA
jgi:D-serine deaminase-like pyridoxal phosphate-dependent protein